MSYFRYGLGMIYYKQEKFSLAEVHFRRALLINPQSSVLLCHVGVVSKQRLLVKNHFIICEFRIAVIVNNLSIVFLYYLIKLEMEGIT